MNYFSCYEKLQNKFLQKELQNKFLSYNIKSTPLKKLKNQPLKFGIILLLGMENKPKNQTEPSN
jgi:hypothetical protein